MERAGKPAGVRTTYRIVSGELPGRRTDAGARRPSGPREEREPSGLQSVELSRCALSAMGIAWCRGGVRGWGPAGAEA